MQINRRGFLRGSAIAAAALVGTTAVPASSFAQEPPQEKKEEPNSDGQSKDGAGKKEGEEAPEQDPFKVTKKDEQGRDYRACPQCGFNMYKQDRTWTCENCGYAYVE